MSSPKEKQPKQDNIVTENVTVSEDTKRDNVDTTETEPHASTPPLSPPPVTTETATTITENETMPDNTQTQDLSKLPGNVGILKEAFPDIDLEVIEAILQAQNDGLESSFEILLGMSDPNYQSTPIPQPEPPTPAMPPRPSSQLPPDGRSRSSTGNAPYAYWERQSQPEPRTVEEQLRMDEEFAKKLAMEDEMRMERSKYYSKMRLKDNWLIET